MGEGEDGAGEVVWGVVMVDGAGMLVGVGGGRSSSSSCLHSLHSSLHSHSSHSHRRF